jgi:hypothetical protein
MKKFIKIIFTMLVVIVGSNGSAGEYLGRIGSNPFCSDCTANPFAPINNPFNPNSPRNPFGKYGNPYSPYSANNPYATQTPKVYGDAPDSGYVE